MELHMEAQTGCLASTHRHAEQYKAICYQEWCIWKVNPSTTSTWHGSAVLLLQRLLQKGAEGINYIKSYIHVLDELEMNVSKFGYGPEDEDEVGPYDWHNEDMNTCEIKLIFMLNHWKEILNILKNSKSNMEAVKRENQKWYLRWSKEVPDIFTPQMIKRGPHYSTVACLVEHQEQMLFYFTTSVGWTRNKSSQCLMTFMPITWRIWKSTILRRITKSWKVLEK